MIPADPSNAVPQVYDVTSLYRSLRVWTIVVVLLGGISVYGTETLDFIWGIVLIVAAILANRYKSPAMFIIFATLMGWAALTNSLMILVGSGAEKLWSVLGLLYMICTIWIIHEYGKYRDFHPEDESSISRRLGLGSVIVASVNLFLLGIATLLVFAYDSLFTT